MADPVFKPKYGTEVTNLEFNLNNLADDGYRSSAQIDNTSLRAGDIHFLIKVTTGSGTIGGNKRIPIWALGSNDGTTWTCGITTEDGDVTGFNAANLGQPVAVIDCPAQTTTYWSPMFAIAHVFGGVLPAFVMLLALNDTNITTDTDAADTSCSYRPVNWEGVTS